MGKIKTALLAAILVLTPAFGQAQPIRVVDGDTIEFQGERIRIAGLDAPELFRPRCPSERALAERAKDRLEGLVLRGVTIQANGRRDRYGRILATVRDTASGQDVADILVNEGLASRYNGRGPRQEWC